MPRATASSRLLSAMMGKGSEQLADSSQLYARMSYSAQLCGAHWGVISGVGEQDSPSGMKRAISEAASAAAMAGHPAQSDVIAPLRLQALGIQLGDHDGALCLTRAVDRPQALFVRRQVDVRVAPPGVRVLSMEARVRQLSPRCQALRGSLPEALCLLTQLGQPPLQLLHLPVQTLFVLLQLASWRPSSSLALDLEPPSPPAIRRLTKASSMVSRDETPSISGFMLLPEQLDSSGLATVKV
ncbi:hypothetical protein EYF80_008262 [Liparis tanakae]|uniref:Uncharacterized protein n=1 Tax=Liparis tanakae TaxID=230148 RepID=A0A4Z2IU34_9TELE|nr:hypothetical protein EYF80_008262 [Liparis tanakae]